MTGRQLCYMYSVALISSEEKLNYESVWFTFTEQQGREHIEKLKECMPVMGLHSWPHSIDEYKEAIRYQVAKDDLHEQRWKEHY